MIQTRDNAHLCADCAGSGIVFNCSQWPACGCPTGGVSGDCKGKTVPCACTEAKPETRGERKAA